MIPKYFMARVVFLFLCLGFSLSSGWAQPPENPRRTFGKDHPFAISDLPDGRFRDQLSALPAAARQQAMEWMETFRFPREDTASLHADRKGGIFYVCHFPLPTAGAIPIASAPTAAELEAEPISSASLPASLYFHSRPGSPNVLYLNFTGFSVTGTVWNDWVGRDPIPARPFDTDGDPNTFSAAEQATIRRIWQRVAEDYAPFDINVTTEPPSTWTTRTAHALITRSTDMNNEPNPGNTGGGIAYVGPFATTQFAYYRPAWIYHDNLHNLEAYIAEAVSHEIGHNMGLSHDGKTDGTEYYAGHGSGDTSWAPIMGAAYTRNVTQWSRGEYSLANNAEDDLAIIAAKTGYRPDDHGNTFATATWLTIDDTTVTVTTLETDPDNLQPHNKGVLFQTTDVDLWTFTVGAGDVSLSIQPWVSPANTRGGNLDIRATLYDADGTSVAVSDPPSETAASLLATVPAGTYYLAIEGVGTGDPMASSPTGYTTYGSLGHYYISGTVPPSTGAPETETQTLYAAGMNANPGWTLGEKWAYGIPDGNSGRPAGGATGSHVIGYELNGNYAKNLNLVYATTPPIDCSTASAVTLTFQRWLGVRSGDTATLRISADNGASWTTLWTASGAVSDSAWQPITFDISDVAAGSDAMRLQWGMGSNNDGQVSFGWYLDDIEVTGEVPPSPTDPVKRSLLLLR